MMPRSPTEIIGRAIVLRDGQILTARERGKRWHFLPGGHVECGEAVESALVRELHEELGMSATVRDFVGIVEHAYTEDEIVHHELNLIFEVDLENPALTSQEDHLEFSWLHLGTLLDVDLRPGSLKLALQGWFADHVPFWRPTNSD